MAAQPSQSPGSSRQLPTVWLSLLPLLDLRHLLCSFLRPGDGVVPHGGEPRGARRPEVRGHPWWPADGPVFHILPTVPVLKGKGGGEGLRREPPSRGPEQENWVSLPGLSVAGAGAQQEQKEQLCGSGVEAQHWSSSVQSWTWVGSGPRFPLVYTQRF